MQIVLASTSPYRRALLQRLGLTFVCDPPGVDESPQPQEAHAALAQRLARTKAQAVAARHPHALVIGSTRSQPWVPTFSANRGPMNTRSRN